MFTLQLGTQCGYTQLSGTCCLKGLKWQYGKVSVASGVVCGEGFIMSSEEWRPHQSETNVVCKSSLLFRVSTES